MQPKEMEIGLHIIHLTRHCCCLVTQSCLSLCNPMDCSIQAYLSITNSCSLLKLISIESVMPSNHLILCHPLPILSSIVPSIRIFSNESVLPIRWPKYWSFSFSHSNEFSGLISFRIDWIDLLAVQGTLKSLLQHYSSKTLMLFFFFWNAGVRVCHLLVVSDSLPPHGLQHTRLLFPRNSIGKNTGIGEPFSSPGGFPHIGIKPEPPGRLKPIRIRSDQIRSVTQSCPTLCDLMNPSTPGLPVHNQLPEFTETHIHRVSDAIQPSHTLSSPSPLALNPSQHQSLFQ